MQEKVEFYIGDLVLKKGSLEANSIYFTGSEKLEDDKWKVNFAFSFTNGYAGHGSSMYLIVTNGEKFRFAQGYKGYDKKQGFMGEKKVLREIESVHFENIEKDCITLSFDFE